MTPAMHPRFLVPCQLWIGAESRRCEAIPTRRYCDGHFCRDHTPAVVQHRAAQRRAAHGRTAHDGEQAAARTDDDDPPHIWSPGSGPGTDVCRSPRRDVRELEYPP